MVEEPSTELTGGQPPGNRQPPGGERTDGRMKNQPSTRRRSTKLGTSGVAIRRVAAAVVVIVAILLIVWPLTHPRLHIPRYTPGAPLDPRHPTTTAPSIHP